MLTEEDLKNKVLICKTPCSNCPFIPGPNALKLKPGRLEQIARDTVQGGRFPCHKAYYDMGREVLCKGWDAVVQPNAVRMAGRFGILKEVNLKDLPPRTPEEITAFLVEREHEER